LTAVLEKHEVHCYHLGERSLGTTVWEYALI